MKKIVSLTGGLRKIFKMKKNDFLDKHLFEIKNHKEFFLDFIKPLFEISIQKGESFQFMFTCSKLEEEFVCSIYPCCIPDNHISSIDVVVRQPQNIISNSTNYLI